MTRHHTEWDSYVGEWQPVPHYGRLIRLTLACGHRVIAPGSASWAMIACRDCHEPATIACWEDLGEH